MDKRLEMIEDENLRSVPVDPVGLRKYIIELLGSLTTVKKNHNKRVSILGEAGVHLRCLGDLKEAEQVLREALRIVNEEQLGLRREVQQKIRLAHVLQYQGQFKRSNALFEEVISVCRTNDEASELLDFALQHAGKNLFDQNRFTEALPLFEEAMKVRMKRNAPEDQIKSTAKAIARTKALLQN
ncbi:tetratricopeptide repeat protein [Bdellovibrio sp. SKB1291214]|uniref:tetratricopeptide repeat protein n=1 Tax=Bdellovibrio sp. SKB1291214 TaxID=1732569 RepID=UPI000B519C24|nr:tetratricopeptide repeat protein [Bdellovibrio sp. SKB1291214]UYL09766.1 tetratricopeptide repeat protein [Bdellovibrio sp. SKB1291214]